MNVLLEQLEQGQLDLVVGRFDNFAPRHSLCSELLYEETMRVICRPGHPLTHQSSLDWEALHDFDWIMWPVGTPIRSKLDIALANAGQRPLPYRVESSSLIANLWLLQLSDMLSIASDRVADHFTQRGLIVPLEFELDALGTLGMCWRKGTENDQGIADLLNSLRYASANQVDFPDAR